MKAAILLFLFFFSIMPASALAQEEVLEVVTTTPTPTPGVVYEMPYPGLLPDSPLYFLKTTRDRLVGFLITDSLKKATFSLLQADKRFQAGVMLFQKDEEKKVLAFEAISKGHNYMDQAIVNASEAKKHQVETTDITGKIMLSLRKQQQILKELEASHPNSKEEITHALERLSQLQKKAKELNLTKR